jgi:glycosyltransferase involved in cell wall biosynthesis
LHVALIHNQVGGRAGGAGGVRLLLELGQALVRRGHRVTVCCYAHEPGGVFSYAEEGLEIRSVTRAVTEAATGQAALARYYWFQTPRIARLVPSDADVINSHDWLALRPGRIAANRLKLPFVWTRNDETPWERAIIPEHTLYGDPRLSHRIIRATLCWPDLRDARRADAIAVLSRPQVALVRRSYAKPSEVVSFGPPPQAFDAPPRDAARASLGIPGDVFQVLAFGVFINNRRFEHLIEAMSFLSDDRRIHAVIAGSDHVDPAYADRLEALIRSHGLGDRVRLDRRAFSDAELVCLYSAADLFTIMSKRYAWGVAPLEALAAGTPVLISDGAGVADVLRGRPGVAIEPMEDPAATAAAIRHARDNMVPGAVQSTRDWLRENLSMNAYAARMEAIYKAATRPV